MALIIDPDLLTYGVAASNPVTIDSAAKTIKLNVGKGPLTSEGVTGQCLYSFMKITWKNDASLIAFPFPMLSITNEQFEFINGWLPADDATRKLIRSAGWAEYGTAGTNISRKYAGIVSLGTIGGSDQAYFQQSTNAGINFTYTGPVNEAVQIMGNLTYDATTTTFDYTTSFKMFVRVQGKKYASSQLSDIGVSTMTYIVYRFPLSNDVDLKIAANDTTISSNAPYSGITVTYFETPQSKTIGASAYNFNVVIEGNGATAEQIYSKIQYQLRQLTDIDAGTGTVLGNTASALLSFVGDTLITSQGVFINNFNASDTNRITFYDNLNVARTYPYKASLVINFNENLMADPSAYFQVFFTDDAAATTPAGKNFGTSTAVTVNDASGTPVAMKGLISGVSSKTFTFDYDGNIQRGAGSSAKDAPITVVAGGLGVAQYVKATGTIARSTANSISLVSALERNFLNP